ANSAHPADCPAAGAGPPYRPVGALRRHRQLRRGGAAGPCQPGTPESAPGPAPACPRLAGATAFPPTSRPRPVRAGAASGLTRGGSAGLGRAAAALAELTAGDPSTPAGSALSI